MQINKNSYNIMQRCIDALHFDAAIEVVRRKRVNYLQKQDKKQTKPHSFVHHRLQKTMK